MFCAPAQRQGYATSALAAVLDIASADPRVRLVAAETLPALSGSQKVLEANGFQRVSEREDADLGPVWRYERRISSPLTPPADP